MTTEPCTRELSDGTRVISPDYRIHSDLSQSILLSSSSSSSSISGIATPIDGAPPKFVAFPKSSAAETGLTSSGFSSSSLEKHRARTVSLPRPPQSQIPRPAKLSLESAKASPVPATPSASEDHSPHGAFSLTSSAEGHLRALVTRVISPHMPSKADGVSYSTIVKRERVSSLRSFPVPWPSISDIEEEEETFWPHQNSAARHDIPAISRSQSPSKPFDGGISDRSKPRSRFASVRSMTASKIETSEEVAKTRKPARVRVKSFSGPSVQSRVRVTLRSPETPPTPRTFLKPAVKNKGKAVMYATLPKSFVPPRDPTTLDPALAAVESASRLRAKCVCVVCGKLGVDYPRCPRCSATWCSRECRVSASPAGSARHSCSGKNNGKGLADRSPLSVGA